LTLGKDGNFYGTTLGGGDSSSGTVFKLTASGASTTLTTSYTFPQTVESPTTGDGAPYYAAIQGLDGDIYGVAPAVYTGFYGVLYKMTPSGQQVFPLLDFIYSNGSIPNLPTQGTDGNFYGTTQAGGLFDLGVVYSADPVSRAPRVLHVFSGYPSDGSFPEGVLVQGNDGNFYGVTYQGGANNLGTIFVVSPSGDYHKDVHDFAGVPTDGTGPLAALTLGSDGNLYGTTIYGGKNNYGAIFQFTPSSGNETVRYDFCSKPGCVDGILPETPLVQHTNGIFYGNTSGNSYGGSVFYSLDMGLGPFTRLGTSSGTVGERVEFQGQGFTGTERVLFNGVPATFRVVSDTELTATVPAGATTGFVSILSPGGTLSSNSMFFVAPSAAPFSPSSGATAQ
jgi:uncharacterized repeat protein (TIGR03803 family)